jgi:hypothetical protein
VGSPDDGVQTDPFEMQWKVNVLNVPPHAGVPEAE